VQNFITGSGIALENKKNIMKFKSWWSCSRIPEQLSYDVFLILADLPADQH